MRLNALIFSLAAIFMAFEETRAQDQVPVAVQLQAISVSAITDKGYKGKATITPYVEIESLDELSRFCRSIPKLVDAVLIAFDEAPLHIKSREQDLAVRQGELKRHIEESIGTGVFVDFHAVNGTRQRGEGTEMIDHEVASRMCQPIAYLPWTKAGHASGGPLNKRIADDIEGLRHRQGQTEAEPFLAESQGSSSAEIDGEEPQRHFPIKAFPGQPPKKEKMPLVVVFLIVAAVGGIMIVIGAYIGYHVAKLRRDRRNKDRRLRQRDRRAPRDRRKKDVGPPEGVEERRSGDDRRSLQDRRAMYERRLQERRSRE